ncbi:MAG: hypothetical protein JSU63_01520 [Phycisphaerales bacterium]|nr:MAG: hypothetical protein JSU63_01520 [Phycisphaerales bacterium]
MGGTAQSEVCGLPRCGVAHLARLGAGVLLALLVILPAHVARGVENASPPGVEATDDEIAALIRDLGDPSYTRRTAATRRLCAIGMRASEMLRVAAADKEDTEAALRAEHLLAVLEQLWFSGVEVELAFSKAEVAWDEAVDLRLTFINRSKYAGRIPFESFTAGLPPKIEDVRQVSVMLDAGDFLRVRSANGKEIDMRVDDIAADPVVAQAVQRRLEGRPSTILEPGQRLSITARSFNRGWARYPLLERGDYSVTLVYDPHWDDEMLARQQVGRAVSKAALLRVTRSAPATVSRSGAEASLVVNRDGNWLVALLTNRQDQPMLVNKNFGGGVPFAIAKWVYTFGDSTGEVPVLPQQWTSWEEFDAALLVEVPPGEAVELARARLGDLLEALRAKGLDVDGQGWTIHFDYSNYCDFRWQERQGPGLLGNSNVPEVLRKPLSRRILSARHVSNRMKASGLP